MAHRKSIPKYETLRPLFEEYERTRDIDLRNRLVTLYYPLVGFYAMQLARRLPKCVEEEALQSSAGLGLIDAIERFEASRNLKFESFARQRIHGAMIDDLRDSAHLSRMALQRLKQIEASEGQFYAVHGRQPTRSELYACCDLEKNFIEDTLRIAETIPVSLDRLFESNHKSDGEMMSVISSVRNEQSIDPTKAIEVQDLVDRILASIPVAAALTLTHYYLLGVKLEDIGKLHFGISESAMSMRLKNAITFARERFGEAA